MPIYFRTWALNSHAKKIRDHESGWQIGPEHPDDLAEPTEHLPGVLPSWHSHSPRPGQ